MIPCQNSKVMGLLSFEQQLPQISEPKLMRAIEYQPQSPLRVQKECYEGKIWVVTGLFSGSMGVGHTGDFLEEMPSLSGTLGKPGRSPHLSSHSRSYDLTVPFITGSSSSTLLSLGMCPNEGFSDRKRKQKRWHASPDLACSGPTPPEVSPLIAVLIQVPK